MSWPAEIDVFLAVGELARYVAYLDGWPPRQRIWPWATALTGLAVSVAGNVGHIQGGPGDPVSVTDRVTAATSPLAASVGLLVVKMTRQQAARRRRAATLMLAPPAPGVVLMRPSGETPDPGPDPRLLRDATLILRTHLPGASVLASALSPGSSAAMGTISPTITCARSRKPSAWPPTWPPEQAGGSRGR